MASSAELTLSQLRDMGFLARELLERGHERQRALELATHAVVSAMGEVQATTAKLCDGSHLITRIGASLGLAWCDYGFPIVDVGQRLGASMMCTRMSKEVAEEIRLPWRCFAIRFPGIIESIDSLFVLGSWSGKGGVQLMWLGSEMMSYGCEPSLSEYADLEFVRSDPEEHLDPSLLETFPGWEGKELLSTHAKLTKMSGRLLLGVCAEMTGFDRVISAGPPKGPRSVKIKRGSPVPRYWSFKLSRPVKVDLRSEVSAYMAGTRGKKLSLQHCVCGHWKWQRCGKDNEQRKWIHVEPYWRGPDDAPIALRPHHLSKGGDS